MSEVYAGKDGIATAEDFRRAAYERADAEFSEPERLTLPGSGLPVIVRRPKPGYFAVRGFPLPQSVAAKAVGDASARAAAEEAQQIASFVVELFEHAMVSPKLSLRPGPDEINPNWLLPEDATFLFRYLIGEVLSDGQDLASFPARPGSPAGEPGKAVEVPSE